MMDMKKLRLVAAAAVLTAAALGSAATAAAVPPTGNAADVAKGLQDQGYIVQFNGQPNGMALSRCSVIGVHGLTVTMFPNGTLMMMMQEHQNDTVFLDLACPDTNN